MEENKEAKIAKEAKIRLEKKLSELLTRCLEDKSFKQTFAKDPKLVLADYGLEVPEDLEVEVVENTPTKIYIVLPNLGQQDVHGKSYGVPRAFGCTFVNEWWCPGVFDGGPWY